MDREWQCSVAEEEEPQSGFSFSWRQLVDCRLDQLVNYVQSVGSQQGEMQGQLDQQYQWVQQQHEGLGQLQQTYQAVQTLAEQMNQLRGKYGELVEVSEAMEFKRLCQLEGCWSDRDMHTSAGQEKFDADRLKIEPLCMKRFLDVKT